MPAKRYRALPRADDALDPDDQGQRPSRGPAAAASGGAAGDGRPADSHGPGTDGPANADPGAGQRGRNRSGGVPSGALLLPPGEQPVVRRTADGWRVGDDELPDLTCAMVLADLIAAELPTQIQPAIQAVPGPAPATAPPAPQPATRHRADGRTQRGDARSPEPAIADMPLEDAANRLRTTIGQLEHALTARIRIEQAIGVLSERHRIRPRQAFEQLRSAARNRGRRVIDIAGDVVASASNPLLQLPEELSRQRTGPRHARNPRRTLRPE
jgi:hypothetical protein